MDGVLSLEYTTNLTVPTLRLNIRSKGKKNHRKPLRGLRPGEVVSSWWIPLPYLLVVPNQNEVLASFAQCGNGVGLKDFSSLFHNDNPRLYLLQNLAIFGSTSGQEKKEAPLRWCTGPTRPHWVSGSMTTEPSHSSRAVVTTVWENKCCWMVTRALYPCWSLLGF